MAAEEDAEVGDGQQISASIRSAKKSSRPTKITEAEAVPAGKQKGKGKGKGKTASGDKPKKITIGKGAFDTEVSLTLHRIQCEEKSLRSVLTLTLGFGSWRS